MSGGQIFWKERAIVTLASANGAALATGTAAAATTADLDARSGGNVPQDFVGILRLTVQWATITSIAAGTVVAEIYAVPKLDGTNLSQTDLTSGSSYISPMSRIGTFVAAKVPTGNTDTRFDSNVFDLFPGLFTVYLLNRSGQSFSANWTLGLYAAQGQYT